MKAGKLAVSAFLFEMQNHLLNDSVLIM